MNRILCLHCKEELEPREGRVILPLMAKGKRASWFTCDGCGTRKAYAYLVKEPDEDPSEQASS